MESRIVWESGMHFIGEADGLTVSLDADPGFGGRGKGPTPKGLLLLSLAGCTAMDVLSLLQKMRCPPKTFSIEVRADVAEAHPRVFTHIHLVYRLSGANLSEEKVRKAVLLSQEKYCSVAAMVKPKVPLSYAIQIDP